MALYVTKITFYKYLPLVEPLVFAALHAGVEAEDTLDL